MVKKRGKKNTSARRSKVSKSRRVSRNTRSARMTSSNLKKQISSNYKKKTGSIIKNLAIYLILFFASWGLYYVSTAEYLVNLFLVLAIIAGFVSIALIIAYVVVFFSKRLGK